MHLSLRKALHKKICRIYLSNKTQILLYIIEWVFMKDKAPYLYVACQPIDQETNQLQTILTN